MKSSQKYRFIGFFLFLLMFVNFCGNHTNISESEKIIRIQGTVRDKVKSSAIKGAAVELGESGWMSSTLLATSKTDEMGFYKLFYKFKGQCPTILYIAAHHQGYESLYYSSIFSDDSIHVYCTDRLQIIDFELER